LHLRAQRAQDATGFKQRGAQPLGERAKRGALADVLRLGYAIEIIGRDQLGMHGEGDGRRHIELSALLPDITRDKLDGRLHFRHDAFSFVDTFQAARAEPFVLGNRTNLLDVSLNICGDELAVAAYSTLQIDKVVGVADAPETRLDLCALRREPLVLMAGRFERLLGVLQTLGSFMAISGQCLAGSSGEMAKRPADTNVSATTTDSKTTADKRLIRFFAFSIWLSNIMEKNAIIPDVDC
jgi:hypothetical protein